MALIKSVMTEQGVPVEYWKVSAFSIDRNRREVRCVLSPWVSKAAYEAGAAPLAAANVSMHICDVEYPAESPYSSILHYTEYFAPEALNGGDMYAALYRYAKAHVPELAGGVDDVG